MEIHVPQTIAKQRGQQGATTLDEERTGGQKRKRANTLAQFGISATPRDGSPEPSGSAAAAAAGSEKSPSASSSSSSSSSSSTSDKKKKNKKQKKHAKKTKKNKRKARKTQDTIKAAKAAERLAKQQAKTDRKQEDVKKKLANQIDPIISQLRLALDTTMTDNHFNQLPQSLRDTAISTNVTVVQIVKDVVAIQDGHANRDITGVTDFKAFKVLAAATKRKIATIEQFLTMVRRVS